MWEMLTHFITPRKHVSSMRGEDPNCRIRILIACERTSGEELSKDIERLVGWRLIDVIVEVVVEGFR